MLFRAHQTMYVKLSSHTLMMITILIDPIHLDTLNNLSPSETSRRCDPAQVLQQVIHILRSHCSLPQLRAAINAGSGEMKNLMELHRSSNFQMGYYFEDLGSQTHAVLRRSVTQAARKDETNEEEEDSKPDPGLIDVRYEPLSILTKALKVILEPYPSPNHQSLPHGFNNLNLKLDQYFSRVPPS